MANVRNTVTDTYQGETIQCAQFVIDTVNQFGEALFATCSIKEDGYYAFQMIAKASTNNTQITVQIANNTAKFTLTDQWAKYEIVVQCQYNTSEPMANKLIFYFPLGTFYMYHSKLEKGNKVTDWSEADYDGRANTDAIKENIYYPGTVYINGGKLMAETVTADKIKVNSLEALSANIGGFKIANNNIECITPTDTNNPSIYLKRYNENTPYTYGESSYTYPSQRHLQNGYIETAVSPNHDYCMPYQHEIFRNADGETWTCAYGDSVKALSNITWEDYESGLTGANSTTRKYIDPNGDYRIETDASLHVRITTGGEITLAQDGYNYPGQTQRETPFRLLDIYCEEVNINNKEVWTAGNLVCGHGESASISSHTGGNATITIPTDEIGSNPVINLTKYNYSDDVWLNSINTSGANTVINVGVYNGGSSARTVKFDYMIAKHS